MSTAIKITEKHLQKRVTDALTALGWHYRHETFSIGSRAGFPDLECWHSEHPSPLYIELKVEKNKPTKAQREWLQTLHDCGQRVAVIRETDHDHAVLLELLTGEYRHLDMVDGVYGLEVD